MAKDPTPSYIVANSLMRYLYQKVDANLSTSMLAIADQHQTLTESPMLGFRYKGETYLTSVSPRKWRPCELHESLHKDMEQVLQAMESLKQERDYVFSFISKVLRSSKNIADYFAVFPQGLHDALRKCFSEEPQQKSELVSSEIEAILKYNQRGYDLVKNRLLKNLLIT